MIILKASLNHFGKFKDYEVTFSPNFHVFYGLNEAGKTTILHFIEGMLFGFYDPFKKGRRTYPIYARYEPSDGIYQGALEIALEGKSYRIERDFKNHDVKVFNAKTGKDITESLPYNSDLKQADISKWLKIPYTLFLNTVRITQSDLETSESAEHELFKRLSNLKKTKSTQFSGDGALKYLKDLKDEIGSKAAPTKPYARALREKEALKTQKKDLESKAKALENLEIESKKTDETLDQLTPELDRLNEALKLQTQQEIAGRIRPIFNTYKETFQRDDFATLMPILIPRVQPNASQLDEALNLQEAIQMKPEKPENYLDEKTFEHKHSELQASLSTRKTLEDTREDITRKMELNTDALNHLNLQDAPVKPKLTWTALFIVPLIIYLFKWIKYRQNLSLYRQQFAYADKESQRLNQVIQSLNEEASTLDQELAHLPAQKDLHDALETLKERREASRNYERDQAAHDERIEKLSELKKALKDTLGLAGLGDDDFTALKTLFELAKDVETQLGRFELKDILTVMNQPHQDLDMTRLESLQKDVKHLEAKRSEFSVKKAALMRDLDAYEDVVARLEDQKALIKSYEAKLTTIKNAEKLLKRSIDIIEENFAPALAEAIESHLKVLTLGRYQSLKVRKNLDFKVEDLDGRLQSATHFSTATLDQIHLAIRLGILEVLGLSDVPLLLDDAFMHFDQTRLEAMLKQLPTLNRQIVLLTAHERESETLNRLQIDFERTELDA